MSEPSHDSPSRDSREEELDSESRATVEWNFFDPEEEVEISARNRPNSHAA